MPHLRLLSSMIDIKRKSNQCKKKSPEFYQLWIKRFPYTVMRMDFHYMQKNLQTSPNHATSIPTRTFYTLNVSFTIMMWIEVDCNSAIEMLPNMFSLEFSNIHYVQSHLSHSSIKCNEGNLGTSSWIRKSFYKSLLLKCKC